MFAVEHQHELGLYRCASFVQLILLPIRNFVSDALQAFSARRRQRLPFACRRDAFGINDL